MSYRSNPLRVPDAVRTLALVVVWLLACEPLAAEPPEPLAALKGHTDDVWCLAFSPDGKTVASASRDRTIRLWDATSGEERVVLKPGGIWINAISFSPDGKALATGGGGGLQLWDLGTRKRITADQEPSPERRSSVAFSPDGKAVAYGGQCDNRLELWDAVTGKLTVALQKPGQSVGPLAVAFAADGRTLVSCRWNDDGLHLDLWDVATRKCRAGAKVGRAAHFAALSQDGTALATDASSVDEGNKVRLLDVTAGRELAKFDEELRFQRFVFSQDGKTLAAGDAWVAVWDVATGKQRVRLRLGDLDRLLALSPNGKVLATCDGQNAIKLWEVARLK